MDFFEAQARARKRTGRLVFLFILAVMGTVLATYVAVTLILAQGSHGVRWDPGVLVSVSALVLAIVGGASLIKWSELKAGGSAVAEMVGGRRISPGQASTSERRLLNVVEEMAIASGVPVPAVYVLDEEEGINAFAAGLTTGDAVVAVTRGTLEKLNRDELQGVVGHEFSHILNGDMRLNVRLTALLFGILVIGLIGRGVLHGMSRVRVRPSNKKNGGAVVVLIALALMVIGYLGYFFGRLIQAAVSRQREFLADASAVQFTRNPLGISGALKRIAVDANGSTLESSKASEIGHFFFAQGFSSWFGGLWATHPPLEERIRAIEPSWDGKFPTSDGGTATAAAPRPGPAQTAGFAGEGSATPPVLGAERRSFQADKAVARAGTVTEQHFEHARQLLARVPVALRDASADRNRAQALILGLLLPAKSEEKQRFLQLCSEKMGTTFAQQLEGLAPEFAGLEAGMKLPLLQLALPQLRDLEAAEGERLLAAAEALVVADAVISPFEMALEKVLVRSLRNARRPSARVDYYDFQVLWQELSVVLSTLAHVGDRDGRSAEMAMSTGLAQLPMADGKIVLLDRAQCSIARFSQSLDKLATASLPIKKRLLSAAAHVIGADGFVSEQEAELYRALAAALDCPMPVWEQAVAPRV